MASASSVSFSNFCSTAFTLRCRKITRIQVEASNWMFHGFFVCFNMKNREIESMSKILMTSNLSLERSLVVFSGESLGVFEARGPTPPRCLSFAAFTVSPPTGNVSHLGVAILNALLGFQARIHRRRNLFVFASTMQRKQLFHQKKQRKKNLFQQKTYKKYVPWNNFSGSWTKSKSHVAYQFPCFHLFASLYEIIMFDMMFGMARQDRISKSAKNTEAGNQFLLQPGAVETASYGVKHTPALWRKSRGWKIHFLAANYGFQQSRNYQNEKFLTQFWTAEPTSLQFMKVAPTPSDSLALGPPGHTQPCFVLDQFATFLVKPLGQ